MIARLPIALGAGFALLSVVTGEVLAHGARGTAAGGYYVTAHSRYGNGEVSAPVRAAQFGYQVKLPGGPWLYCEGNSLIFGKNRPCSETLRRQTLDFWETIDEEGTSRR